MLTYLFIYLLKQVISHFRLISAVLQIYFKTLAFLVELF